MIKINPKEEPTKSLHNYLLSSIGPRPIALASTIDKNGCPNLSPFSYFNIFSSNPPILIFSPARRVRNNTTKDTLENAKEVPFWIFHGDMDKVVSVKNSRDAYQLLKKSVKDQLTY